MRHLLARCLKSLRGPVSALLLLMSLSTVCPGQESEATVLLRARLIDPVSERIDPGSLLLEAGRVIARGSFAGDELRERSPAAAVIDLDGSHLLPGLVDLRVHAGAQRSPGHVDELGAESTARLLLAAGVTRYVDVHLDEEARRWAREQRSVFSLAALSYRGAPILTAPGGFGLEFPSALALHSPADVDSLVQTLAPPHAPDRSPLLTVIFDSRRPYRRLDPALLESLVDGCRQRSLSCVVAAGTWRDVEDALAAGATWICHLPDGEVPSSVLDHVRENEVRWTPTVAVGLDLAQLISEADLRAGPLLRRVAPDELLQDYPQVRIPQARFSDLRVRRREAYANLAALHSAGARWRAGSDAGSVATFFGWTLHRELEHWSEAGLDPWSILAAATVESAAELDLRSGFEEGARADYLVLPRSPVDDLSALSEVDHVVLAGRWVDAAAVAAHVPREIRAQDPPSPLPFGGRGSLFILAVIFFAVLLGLRHMVKRAARSS